MEYRVVVRGIVSLYINESLDEIKDITNRMARLLRVDYNKLFTDVMCQMWNYREV